MAARQKVGLVLPPFSMKQVKQLMLTGGENNGLKETVREVNYQNSVYSVCLEVSCLIKCGVAK